MSKEQNKSQFGRYATHYVESMPHAKGASLTRLVELTRPQPEWHLLDIATGAGHTAFQFAPLVKQVTATDITPEMLALVEKQATERGLKNINAELADAEELTYANGRFHLVTCRIAPHHFENIPAFLHEAVRVLQPGGLLAVVDNVVPRGEAGEFINAFEKRRDPSHGRCLTLAEWEAGFRTAELHLQTVETLGKTMEFTAWAKRHPAKVQQELRNMLENAPTAAKSFLKPNGAGTQLTFQLLEGIIIGQKRGRRR